MDPAVCPVPIEITFAAVPVPRFTVFAPVFPVPRFTVCTPVPPPKVIVPV